MMTDLYINGMFPQSIPLVYDAANTDAGKGGTSITSPSRHSVGAMKLEHETSKIGVFIQPYDPELAAILMGEFI